MFQNGYNNYGAVDALEDVDLIGLDDREVEKSHVVRFDRDEIVEAEWAPGIIKKARVLGFYGRDDDFAKRFVEVQFLHDKFVARFMPNKLLKLS